MFKDHHSSIVYIAKSYKHESTGEQIQYLHTMKYYAAVKMRTSEL